MTFWLGFGAASYVALGTVFTLSLFARRRKGLASEIGPLVTLMFLFWPLVAVVDSVMQGIES